MRLRYPERRHIDNTSLVSTSATLVISSRNEGELLEKTVRSALAAKGETSFGITIVDDGSSDNSTDFLTKTGEKHRSGGLHHSSGGIRLIRTEGLGITGARNLGAANSDGDILVFADAHSLFPDYWLDGLCGELLSGGADAVCPEILPFDSCAAIGFAATAGINDSEGAHQMCGKTLSGLTESRWLRGVSVPTEVPILPGGCFAVKADVFRAVGGYSDGFKKYGWDEEDISLKLWTFGYAAKAVPSVKIKHYFREVMPYPTTNEDYLFNLCLLAMLHYSDERIAKIKGMLGGIHVAKDIFGQVFDNERFRKMRVENINRRIYPDDWVFAKFGLAL